MLVILGIDPFLFLRDERPVAARADHFLAILGWNNPEEDHMTMGADQPDHPGAPVRRNGLRLLRPPKRGQDSVSEAQKVRTPISYAGACCSRQSR
jgi:hypothetical protein